MPIETSDGRLGDRALIGAAAIVRLAYEGGDLSALLQALQARFTADPGDTNALMDVATLMIVAGHRDTAMKFQSAALQQQRCYTRVHGDGSGLRLLIFKVAGDFMANMPVEFLIENSDIVLHSYYVDAQTLSIEDVPSHDVAMVAIGESDSSKAVLDNLSRLLADWRHPIMNGAPERIAALSRVGVADAMAGETTSIAVAPIQRMSRASLELASQRQIGSELLLPGRGFPVLVRPIASHAGQGLAKIDDPDAIGAYLAVQPDDQFYVSKFIDYAGTDGLYRKYRIAVIDGIGYASHMAISQHWMVHYLNADMEAQASRRAEEAAWMRDFERDFGKRHKLAFEALARALGLDYFVIDCAESPDGRLLLFEVDVAMIVHALDSERTFPYKKPAMLRLFTAFQDSLRRRQVRSRGLVAETCAHTGRPPVYQRSRDDCLICALAMFAGRTYGDVVAAAKSLDPSFPVHGPMSHSMLRGVAHQWGYALLSGIYMEWSKPAIIGLRSPTSPNMGHAVFWDGDRIIDPGPSLIVDRDYVDRNSIEFTLRACDLRMVIEFENAAQHAIGTVSALELA